MPAPTALLRRPEELAEGTNAPAPNQNQDDEFLLDVPEATSAELDTILPPAGDDSEMHIDEEGRPRFAPAKNIDPVTRPPGPRSIPLLSRHLKLQVRMNIKNKAVELRTSKHTTDTGSLQKGEDFVKAFSLGFDVDDAIALLRLDDLYIQTFEIKDVKTLQGEHLGRAIGRIAGKDGKTKFAIENASRTRVVLADSKIHILGGFKNIHIAREAIVSLILGSPPGKVYGNLRTVASRMKERF
ncbi:hypothetical protein EYC84_006451 [Monilinia fructicola]|uniref:Pre-rRNA-processing protein PNO1 n=1 Tax=Monilinia fructicola TaxID=38448 RepID=A0A5M9KBM8_MONFR|nr:hypothetical protein EYC84_006451 [Monilinia fructicola]